MKTPDTRIGNYPDTLTTAARYLQWAKSRNLKSVHTFPDDNNKRTNAYKVKTMAFDLKLSPHDVDPADYETKGARR